MQLEPWKDAAKKAKAKAKSRDDGVDLGVNLNPAAPARPAPVPPPAADHVRDERTRAAEAFASAAVAAKARGEKPSPPPREVYPRTVGWGRSIGDFMLSLICLFSFIGMFAAPGSSAPACFVVSLVAGFILTELRRIADSLAATAVAATPRPKAVVNTRDGV